MLKTFLKKYDDFTAFMSYSQESALGFRPGLDAEAALTLINRGFWNILYLGKGLMDHYGIRIMPGKPWLEWPIVVTHNYYGILGEEHRLNAITTVGPSVKHMFEFLKFESIATSRFDNYSFDEEDEEAFRSFTSCFADMLDNKEGVDFLIDFIKKINGEKISEKKAERLVIDFWGHYDHSEGNALLRESMTKMQKDRKYMLQLDPAKDYGPLQTRLYHLLASRLTDDIVKEGTIPAQVLLNCFDEPNFIDTQWTFDYEQRIANATDAKFPTNDMVTALMNAKFLKKDGDPLYHPAWEIYTKEIDQYLGIQHLEIAALFDMERNEPLRSWNAIMNSMYWCGRAGSAPFPMEHALTVALDLCIANNWEDAKTAIEYQQALFQRLTAEKPRSTYRFINELGETVMQGDLDDGDNAISTEELAPGKYIIEVINGDEKTEQEFVKD